MFPYVVEALSIEQNLAFVSRPKCLFLTALNSIRDSLAENMNKLGLDAVILTLENCKEVVQSETVKIIFISPEMLNHKTILQALLSAKESIVIKCVDEAHLFVQWGSLRSKSNRSFRPVMKLSNGELSCLGGITLIQSATLSAKSIRILEEEFPEVHKWTKILNTPYRSNIAIIVPPPKILPSNYQDLLAPYIRRIIDEDETFLFIVRSINSGTEIYFYLLSTLGCSSDHKSVAFYHRSSSDRRREEILRDLALPLDHPDKSYRAVVATISLGVGVDIRVTNVVCLGLGCTPESLVQEAGRAMRGKRREDDKVGQAFFLQKGSVAAVHCPSDSDCRSLITDPLPKCQTETLFKFFEPDFIADVMPCNCCFSCRSIHSENGCETCYMFLRTFIPQKSSKIRCSSVRKGLKQAVMDLFLGLGLDTIKVEQVLSLKIEDFATDFVKNFDEISSPSDIEELWHIPKMLAEDMFDVSSEFLKLDGGEDYEVEGLESREVGEVESENVLSETESSVSSSCEYSEDDSVMSSEDLISTDSDETTD